MICNTLILQPMQGRRVSELRGQLELGDPEVVSLYLAGPIDSSGREDLNLPTFHRAAKELRERGFMVFNPAERLGMKALPGGEFRDEIQRRNIKGLTGCDVLALLPGWEKSPGVEAELLVARECGIPVVRIHELLPTWPAYDVDAAPRVLKDEPANNRGRVHVPLLVGAAAFTLAILVFVYLLVSYAPK